MRQMCGRGKIAGIASLFTENLPWDRKKKQRWISWVWSQEEKSGVLKDLELRSSPSVNYRKYKGVLDWCLSYCARLGIWIEDSHPASYLCVDVKLKASKNTSPLLS